MFGEHTCDTDTVPESEASTCPTGSAAKIAQRVQSLAAAARKITDQPNNTRTRMGSSPVSRSCLLPPLLLSRVETSVTARQCSRSLASMAADHPRVSARYCIRNHQRPEYITYGTQGRAGAEPSRGGMAGTGERRQTNGRVTTFMCVFSTYLIVSSRLQKRAPIFSEDGPQLN
ncbi:hypothetical protein IEO21_04285 [Rhodonia placenta]|uniref:Uncharacterized protein n=1 Tax=Rhodonia placenta TaxID=104341 RepID=A0A8H7P3Z2_9APHY|nr:hypothetical protein IEO21_04285 [Postia placenta]